MSDLSVQNLNIKLRQLDPKAPGFLPMYRRLLAASRAINNFAKATPEDVDEVYALLAQHMIEPATENEKRKVLDLISADDMVAIFNHVMGANTVPPPNGAG